MEGMARQFGLALADPKRPELGWRMARKWTPNLSPLDRSKQLADKREKKH